MWHYGNFDGLFYRPVCAYPGGKTTELYRLQPLVYCMAFTLYRTKFVCSIISGILLIDIGMQCIQLSNQTTIFALNPKASNRINTIFMTTYFAGGSLGTFLAGTFWHWFGWSGVVGTGIALTACSLVINIRAKNKSGIHITQVNFQCLDRDINLTDRNAQRYNE